MSRRDYGTGSWSIDNMILSIDQAIGFPSRLGLDPTVMRAIRDVYAEAASMGPGGRDVSAVYEAVDPKWAD
jgi:3-hydroxyisobutyrate dehydrogenase-like beta-hydroxyacid dehydrogenase